jgi:hypothetical protein
MHALSGGGSSRVPVQARQKAGHQPGHQAGSWSWLRTNTYLNFIPTFQQSQEPYISFSQKALRLCGSGVTVLFFVRTFASKQMDGWPMMMCCCPSPHLQISLVIALLLGIIVYRVIVRQVFFRRENSEFIQSQAVIFTTATAALINLVFILIMNYFYNRLALKLTNWECPRTQSEFDNSFTFKGPSGPFLACKTIPFAILFLILQYK